MFVVLVFIHLLSGQLVPRTSVTLDRAACEDSKPFFIKLYTQGKFEDGPPPEKIKYIEAMCIDAGNKKPPRSDLRGSFVNEGSGSSLLEPVVEQDAVPAKTHNSSHHGKDRSGVKAKGRNRR